MDQGFTPAPGRMDGEMKRAGGKDRLQFTSSLRFRILLLVLLSALPALVLILYSGLEQRQMSRASAQEDAFRLARLAASNHSALLEGANQFLAAIAKLPQLHSDDLSGCDQLLDEIVSQYRRYRWMRLASHTGEILCSSTFSDTIPDPLGQIHFQEALENGSFAVGNFFVVPETERAVLPIAYPIQDNQGQDRVLLSTLELHWLEEMTSEIELPEMSALLIVTQDGTVVARVPDPETWVGRVLPEAPIIRTIITERGEGTVEAAGIDGIVRLFAFIPLRGLGERAYVSFGIPTHIAYAEANQQLARNLFTLGLITFFALAVAWYSGSVFILNKVNAVLKAAKRMTAGDLSARTGVEPGQGELHQLAAGFDEMAKTVQLREMQVRQAESRFRALVEQIPAITYTTRLDEDGSYIYISPQVEAMLGFTPQEWLSDPQRLSKQLHRDDCDRVLAQIRDGRQNRKGIRLEYRLLTRERRTVWIRDESTIVSDETGTPLFIQGVMFDISERKKSEADLERYATQLERSNRELQDFAYITSHDLQEPLRKIQAFGERLKAKQGASLGEDGLDYIERMRNSSARMQALINDLLVYSRLTTKALPFVPTNLNMIANEVASNLELLIDERHGRLEIGDLPTVDADPVQMRQLLQNLIQNGLKFHQPGKSPVIKVYSQDGNMERRWVKQVDIVVEDNGIGFDEKYLDRIFQPFQRLHPRNEFEGSGIGLSICRKIVERHGGSITAKSKPGLGSKFIFTLPINHVNTEIGEPI
jgi:PAS domain S-box-containing protein